MPSRSTAVALGCTVAAALGGGAAFVQPGSVRAAARSQLPTAGVQRWEAVEEPEVPQAEGSPATGLLVGLALGVCVALAGATQAQATNTQGTAAGGFPAKDKRTREGPAKETIPSIFDYATKEEIDADAKARAKKMNEGHWTPGVWDKKYVEVSTGSGKFLDFNLALYNDVPAYQGTAASDGTYVFTPGQVQRAKAYKEELKEFKERVLPILKKEGDGGKFGKVFPDFGGMYQPRTYTSEYQPERLK